MDTTYKELIRKAKAAAVRDWRRKNPEKAKAIEERYWLKRAAKLAAEQEEKHD